MLLILLWSRKSFFKQVSCSNPSTFLRMLKETSSCLSPNRDVYKDSRRCKLNSGTFHIYISPFTYIPTSTNKTALKTHSNSVSWCRFSSLRIWLSYRSSSRSDVKLSRFSIFLMRFWRKDSVCVKDKELQPLNPTPQCLYYQYSILAVNEEN